jgi:DNA-binding transcriptional MerR regulator
MGDANSLERAGRMKVGDVARLFGTTARTVLYYEEQGIISPRRTAGGTRLYAEIDLRRFDVAYRMASLGVPLAIVRDVARARSTSRSGDEAGRRLCAMIAGLKSHVERQIRSLEGLREDLDRGLTLARQCWDCPNSPSRSTCPGCPSEVYVESARILALACGQETAETPSHPAAVTNLVAARPRTARSRTG